MIKQRLVKTRKTRPNLLQKLTKQRRVNLGKRRKTSHLKMSVKIVIGRTEVTEFILQLKGCEMIKEIRETIDMIDMMVDQVVHLEVGNLSEVQEVEAEVGEVMWKEDLDEVVVAVAGVAENTAAMMVTWTLNLITEEQDRVVPHMLTKQDRSVLRNGMVKKMSTLNSKKRWKKFPSVSETKMKRVMCRQMN